MTRDEHVRAWRTLQDLQLELRRLHDGEPEQDVRGMAVPVLDAALSDVKAFLGGDPVVSVIRDVISAEAFADADEGVRVVDVLLVVTMLMTRVGRPKIEVQHTRPF